MLKQQCVHCGIPTKIFIGNRKCDRCKDGIPRSFTNSEDSLKHFMNQGADATDEYWKLFDVKNLVNDTIVKAVGYGYKKGHEAASKEIIGAKTKYAGDFGPQLLKALKKKDMSQKALADETKITRSLMNQYINADVDPSLMNLLKILRGLNMTLEQLYGIE